MRNLDHVMTSTDDFQAWESALHGVCGLMDAEPMRHLPFNGKIDVRHVGKLEMVRHAAGIGGVRRQDNHISDLDSRHCFLIHQVRGMSVMRQGTNEAWLKTGDWSLVDSAMPFDFRFHDPLAHFALHLPRDAVLSRLKGNYAPSAQYIDGQTGAGALLTAFSTTLYEQAPLLSAAPGPYLDNILDLLCSALGVYALDETVPGQLRAVTAYIEENLGDPGLAPGTIAEAMGISTRHLHRLFRAAGGSVGTWLRRRRLERARCDLGSPANAHRSVTAIAFDCGFNDASHFSRAFRGEYGLSPRAFRERQRDLRN